MAIGRHEGMLNRAQIDLNVAQIEAQDQRGSHRGFDVEHRQMSAEYTQALSEFEHDPDACEQMLNSMDADAQLMRQVICSRRGTLGAFNRLTSSRGWRTAKRFLGSAAVGLGLRTATKAIVHTTAPVLGAITGGASGGFWSFVRSRNQVESASTWMSQVGILNLHRNDIINNMNDAEIESALGILRNAIMAKKVRGSEQQKLEMASKYRLMRNELQRRRQEALDNNQELNPVLQRVDVALQGAANEFQLISQAAGEQYRETFGKIEQIKKDQVKMATIKGALVGAAVGGVAGFVVDYAIHHGGLGGIVDNIKDRFHIGSGHGSELTQPRLDDLRDHSALAQSDIAHHDTDLRVYQEYSDGTRGWDALTPEQQTVCGHIDNLKGMGGDASISGLHPGEIARFDGLLGQTGADAHHNLYTFATNHNIDLTYDLPSGQEFGTFLEANKAIFGAMPEHVQHFVLTNPSLAEEILNMVKSGSAHSAIAILSRLAGPVALAGAGIGAYSAHRKKQSLDAQIGREVSTPRQAASREVEQWNRTAQERARQEVRNRIIGNRVIFNATFWPPTSFTGRGSNQYDVTGVDGNGNLTFADNEWDAAQRLTGVNPHPVVRMDPRNGVVNNAITPDNQINPAVIASLAYGTAPEAEAQRQREQTQRQERTANLEAARTRLQGAVVEFFTGATPGFVAMPTRRNNEFTVRNITPSGILEFDYNADENTRRSRGAVITLPTINIRGLVDADNNLNPAMVKVIRESAAPEPVPGTPAAPEAFDRTQYEPMLRLTNPLQGQIVTRGGQPFFRITSTRVPAAVATALGAGVREFRINKTSIANIPPGVELWVQPRDVAEEDSAPSFEGDVFYQFNYAGGSPERYNPSAKYGVGNAGGKAQFLTTLQTLAATGGVPNDMMLYLTAPRQFYRFEGTFAAPSYRFERVSDAAGGIVDAPIDIDQTTLQAQEFYLFRR